LADIEKAMAQIAAAAVRERKQSSS
jgi:hypothetical protein